MKIASVAEVKAQFSAFLKASEGGPVVVTRNGRAVAVLIGVQDEEEIERLLMAYSPRLRAILEESRRAWIEEAGVAPLYAEAMRLGDGAGRLRMAARWTRRQFELGLDVVTAYQEAARSDPRAARVWSDALAVRERAIRGLVASLGPGLRPGLTVERGRIEVILGE